MIILVNRAPLLLLSRSLTGLTSDEFASILDALTLVDFGRSLVSNESSKIANSKFLFMVTFFIMPTNYVNGFETKRERRTSMYVEDKGQRILIRAGDYALAR